MTIYPYYYRKFNKKLLIKKHLEAIKRLQKLYDDIIAEEQTITNHYYCGLKNNICKSIKYIKRKIRKEMK